MARQYWWLAALLPLFLIGCPAQSPESESAAGDDESMVFMETFSGTGLRTAATLGSTSLDTLRMAHQDFALADYRRLAFKESNIITSVVDTQLLLSMVSLGAAGTTLSAVNNASGFVLDGELPHALVNEWDQHLADQAGIQVQRYLWGQERYPFAEEYLDSQVSFYGPEMMALDFQTAATNSAIQINGTLPNLPQSDFIDHRSRLVIAQSLEASRTWSAELDQESFSGRFAVGDGQRQLDMMRFQGLLSITESEEYRAVEIPLAGQELALLIIEPKVSLAAVQNNLDQAGFQNILEQLRLQQSEVVVPLFDIRVEFRDDDVADLGVALVESDDAVESGIAPGSNVIIIDTEIMEEGESLPAMEEASDSEANFYSVNEAGYLYLNGLRQWVAVAVTTEGISTVAASAVAHQAKHSEPGWLFDGGESDNRPGLVTTTQGSSSIPCYYPPDQQPFLFVLYAKTSGVLLATGHVSEPKGEEVAADWMDDLGWPGCGESPPVKIYQHAGAVQCESNGVDPYTMRDELLGAGINVLDWGRGSNGSVYISLCGVTTGDINYFTIREQDIELAQRLGFSLLSELENPTL